MIVIDPAALRQLARGTSIVIPDSDQRYRKGGIYDVGVRKTALCRAQVIKIEADSVRIQVVYQQQATMLARSSTHGYTDDPAKALFREPEAIGPEMLEAMTREQRELFRAELRAFSDDVQQRAEDLAARRSSGPPPAAEPQPDRRGALTQPQIRDRQACPRASARRSPEAAFARGARSTGTSHASV